jgi:hypothetical protein
MNRIAAAGQSPRSLKLEISSLRQPPLNRRSRQEKIPVGNQGEVSAGRQQSTKQRHFIWVAVGEEEDAAPNGQHTSSAGGRAELAAC